MLHGLILLNRATRSAAVALLVLGAIASAPATTVRPPTLDELVTHADYVVRVETLEVHSEWRVAAAGRYIVSIVKARVLERLVGDAPEILHLEFLGGTIGTRTMRVTDQPELWPGERDILFIRGNRREACPLVHMMYGRFRIISGSPVTGDDRIAREDGTLLRSVADISVKLPAGSGDRRALATSANETGGILVSEFEAQIRQAAFRIRQQPFVR